MNIEVCEVYQEIKNGFKNQVYFKKYVIKWNVYWL